MDKIPKPEGRAPGGPCDSTPVAVDRFNDQSLCRYSATQNTRNEINNP